MSDCANGGRRYGTPQRVDMTANFSGYTEQPWKYVIDRQGRTMTRIELRGVDNPSVQVVIDGVRYVPAPPYKEKCEVLD